MELDKLEMWISRVKSELGDSTQASAFLADEFDGRPPKRRRLSRSPAPRKRAKSDPGVDNTLPVQFSPPLDMMPEKKRSMGPPISPSRTRSSKSRRSSQANTESVDSPSSSTTLGITATGYRQKVLLPNKIIFERSAKALPKPVHDALDQIEQHVPAAHPAAITRTIMTAEQAACLVDALETPDAGPEEEFCSLLRQNLVIPPWDHDRGLRCTAGLLFKCDGLPRSDFPDRYYAVSAPKPDYAFGYNDFAFDVKQQASAQSCLYEPYNGLYWPFLIIEAKSQPMGNNCFQAANQCAAGGTIGVNAIATLLDRAYPQISGSKDEPPHPGDEPERSPVLPTTISSEQPSANSQSAVSSTDVPPEVGACNPATPEARGTTLPDGPEAIVFSVAVDTMGAELYVHWRNEDKVTFHLQRVAGYFIIRGDEMIQLQKKLRQIVDWGMGPRLVAIKAALNTLRNPPSQKPISSRP
jgi:hypothetical protein